MTWRQQGYLQLAIDIPFAVVISAMGYWLAGIIVAMVAGAVAGILVWEARA